MAEFFRPAHKNDLALAFAPLKPAMHATMAQQESARCLFCYDAPCVKACPTEIDIPLFIRQIHTQNLEGAARTIYTANYFGHACGQVCPTEVLCEGACVYNHQHAKPIEIGRLQSYAASAAVRQGTALFSPGQPNGKAVAVVGAGPAGIAAACELRRLGYQVDVFEAKAQVSGLILHGCAPYKITNQEAVQEIAWLQQQLGFQIHLNHPVQNSAQWRELETHYDAILLAIGLGKAKRLNIPGTQLAHVKEAMEFIESVKTQPLQTNVGKRVVVIGGGNTAMDAASECARLGAEEVIVTYRRGKEAMPAYAFEYELAKSAGVQFRFHLAPAEIFGANAVEGVRFVENAPSAGHGDVIIPCDMVIMATGQETMQALLADIGHIATAADGRIVVDAHTFQTSRPRYFAAGDAVNGGAEVVNAVSEGKRAAQGIHQVLSASWQ